jgi:hypothetical protein
MNIRPHPDPLPQEREKDFPPTNASNGPGDQTRFNTNQFVSEIASKPCDLSRGVASRSLSPGERAGVRADVNSFQFFVGAFFLSL